LNAKELEGISIALHECVTDQRRITEADRRHSLDDTNIGVA
jgi:hypothetical protein